MGLIKLFKEYVNRVEGKNFKGFEYFKYVINKKSVRWIEDQISNNLIKPEKLTTNRNLLLDTHGSQYIKMYYGNKQEKIIFRMSTHKEDKTISDNAHYAINSWDTNEREIEEHINSFIDYSIIYFNAIEKKKENIDLSKHERDIYLKIKNGDYLYEDSTYPNMDAVHKKAVKKKLNNTSPEYINLP